MNIQTVATNLRNTIAGKEQALKSWRDCDPLETSDRVHRAVMVGMLEINVDELKRILADVEKCCEKATADSWALSPDRSGGQFTQDEIYNPERTGWIEP